jgi:putative protease
MFIAEPVELQLSQAWFLPVSAVNALRREAESSKPPAWPATRARRVPNPQSIRCPTRRRS